ncbi:uncharacterized protein LOC117823884 [Notolabrus celidotus]|uniref:uncharacterized protein LOC117823884 n=1 Tax=Notolabrus celidotus TaxID=1203425 RepID=UPI00148FB607|nr:uncharacterized protein LOC117823884 [Notolabrus celidotus]
MTMDEFTWIHMLLFLAAVFQLSAGGNQPLYLTIREGVEVTLPCENVMNSQRECDSTTWLFVDSRNSSEVELVTRGKIGENAGSQSNGLRVTEDCSLLMKVTEEGVGRYTCQQYKSGTKQSPDALIYLFLLTMSEQQNVDSVTLRCSVSSHRVCAHRVKWLFEGKDVKRHGVASLDFPCYTFVTIQTDQHMYKSRFKSLKCEVTIDNKVQLFPFRLQPAGEDMVQMTIPATTTTTTTTVRVMTESTMTTEDSIYAVFADRWRIIIVSVGLAALLIAVVTVNIWSRIKGTKTQEDEKKTDSHEDEDMENYDDVRSP